MGGRPITDDRWAVVQWSDTKRPSVRGLDGAVASVTSGRQDHATLIATAPAMREALRGVLCHQGHLALCNNQYRGACTSNCAAARAALAEADGGES